MLCFFYLAVFGLLGIFSASHRELFFESLECVKNTFTRQPCETDLEQKVKASITHSLFLRSPWVARQVNRHFRVISWAFVVLTVLTGFLTLEVIYDLAVYGTCTPGSSGGCTISNTQKLLDQLRGILG